MTTSSTKFSPSCFEANEFPDEAPTSFSVPQWGTADAEIKTHLLGTLSSKALPLKPRAGENIAMHASPTARNFFVELIFTFPVHSLS